MNKYLSKRNQIIVGAIVIFLVAGIGGYEIGKSRTFSTPSQFGGSGARNGQGLNNRRPGAGIVSGDILSKDEKSLTVKLRNGGSQIILVSPSVEVSKMSPTDQSELQVGKSVMITGVANADGSMTATSIQIRPVVPLGGGQGGPVGN